MHPRPSGMPLSIPASPEQRPPGQSVGRIACGPSGRSDGRFRGSSIPRSKLLHRDVLSTFLRRHETSASTGGAWSDLLLRVLPFAWAQKVRPGSPRVWRSRTDLPAWRQAVARFVCGAGFQFVSPCHSGPADNATLGWRQPHQKAGASNEVAFRMAAISLIRHARGPTSRSEIRRPLSLRLPSVRSASLGSSLCRLI